MCDTAMLVRGQAVDAQSSGLVLDAGDAGRCRWCRTATGSLGGWQACQCTAAVLQHLMQLL